MVKLQHLYLRNVLGWKDLQFDLTLPGITYIVGPNGSGKSSIVAGLLWVLTGECSRVKTLDELVRVGSSKGAYGTLQAVIGSRKVRISRYRKHVRFKNSVRIWIDGEEVSVRHVRSAHKVVESLLTTTYSAAVRSLVFASDETALFLRLPEARQKGILREYLQLDLFERAQAAISEKIRKINTVSGTLQFQVEHLRGKLIEAERQERYSTKVLEDAKQVSSSEIGKLHQEAEKLEQQRVSLVTSLSSLKSHVTQLREDKRELQSLIYQVDRLNLQLQELRQTRVCPQCQRPLPKPQFQEQIATISQRKKVLLSQIKDLEYKVHQAGETLEDVTYRYEQLEHEWREVVRRIEEVQSQIKAYQRDIQYEQKRVDEIRIRVKTLRTGLVQVSKRLERVERRGNYYDWWHSHFGSRGIETLALKKALPIINLRLSKILLEMPTQHGHLEAAWTMQQDRLRTWFTYGSRREVSYEALSGGERRRADFAVAVVLYQLYQSLFNVLFLDEPFEALDSQGIQSVLRTLRLLQIPSIFITSHRGDLEGFFDRTVFCKNTGTFCVLEGIREHGSNVLGYAGV